MKILILCQTYPPEVGAAPSRISNMAEAFVKNDHEVDVICGLPNYPKGKIFEGYRGIFSKHEKWNGVNVHRYWTFASNSSNAVARIAMMFSLAISILFFAFRYKKIKSFNYVILQTPPLPLASSGMILFKKLYRKKVVLNVSDIWPSTGVELGAIKKDGLPYKFMYLMERFLYRNADAFLGQSSEIIEEIESFKFDKKPIFLYRNLQHDSSVELPLKVRKPFKIVYAGLLGVAQNLLEIVRNLDLKKLDSEFHIYGSGKQMEEIRLYASDKSNNVYYHGSLPKEEIVKILPTYNASIVPLAQRIYGAVPSKIFDLMPLGVPILFCGGGEGSEIIDKNRIGFHSEPGDYEALSGNIKKLIDLPDLEYNCMVKREIDLSKTEFSFNSQFGRFIEFLKSI